MYSIVLKHSRIWAETIQNLNIRIVNSKRSLTDHVECFFPPNVERVVQGLAVALSVDGDVNVLGELLDVILARGEGVAIGDEPESNPSVNFTHIHAAFLSESFFGKAFMCLQFRIIIFREKILPQKL